MKMNFNIHAATATGRATGGTQSERRQLEKNLFKYRPVI
jgi:hypothetical protein